MKHAVRQEMREKRKALSPDLYAKKSELIRQKLENLGNFKSAEKILIYISNNEEVDTRSIIKDALKAGRQIFVPKMDGEDLVICPLNNWEDLEEGPMGIMEPCEIVSRHNPMHLDLIVVPGIAFDKRAHRIGYGRGFYDRFLPQTKAFKVGLAFQEQVVDDLPIEEHDIPLDLIITDQTLLYP